MERVLLTGIFLCAVGAVYTGLSLDEYGVAPVAALSVVALILISLALLRLSGGRGGER